MPRLLSQRKKSQPRKRPPCGRIIEYVAPHSPFQKLIEAARLRYGLSIRSLAQAIGTSQSNVYIWTHNKNGFPHTKSFKESHLMGLSKELHIPAEQIRQAIDASRSIYTKGEIQSPAPAVDAMKTLIEILEHEKRVRVTTSYVLNLARNLYAGSIQK